MVVGEVRVWWAWLACLHHTELRFPLKAEPETAEGHIVVMPLVGAYAPPSVRLDAGLAGKLVSQDRADVRRARTREARRVPHQFALALPGQVAAVLGDQWEARFTAGQLSGATADRLRQALRRNAEIDPLLAEIARSTRASGVWFSWVDALTAEPLTAEADAGDVVIAGDSPVVVDFADEPYRVIARLGAALVDRDGQVVLRYEDAFEVLLSGDHGARGAGMALARALARDAAAYWPDDPTEGDAAPWVPPESNPSGRRPVPEVPFSGSARTPPSQAP